MFEAQGASHVDAATDGVDPSGAGIRHDDSGGAQNRKAADDAEPGIERPLGNLLAAGNRNFDNHIARGAAYAGGFLDRSRDHKAGRRIDRRFSWSQGQARTGDGPHSLSGAKGDARCCGPARNFGDYQGAMRHIGIVTRVLDNTRACEPLAKLRQGKRKGWPRSARKGNSDGIGKVARKERLVSRARGGGGASACCPAPPQFRLRGSVLLGIAHWAFS
jgi:hypothetical protein